MPARGRRLLMWRTVDTTYKYKYKYKYKRKKIADVEDMDTTYKCLCAESAISCPELDHCAICYVSNYPTYQVWNKGKSGKNPKVLNSMSH